MSKLNKKVSEVRSDKSLSAEERRARLERLEAQQLTRYKLLNNRVMAIERHFTPLTCADAILRGMGKNFLSGDDTRSR